MTEFAESTVRFLCEKHGNDRTNMMDIVWAVQTRLGSISHESMGYIADCLGITKVEVESFVSFYAFLSDHPKGKVIIRICDDIIDRMHGYDRVLAAFEEELGIKLGETTPDGKITLERTACVGLSDQAPAAIINATPVTELGAHKAREIAQKLKAGTPPAKLVHRLGDGNNAHPLIRAMVKNNIRREGPVIFSPIKRGEAIKKAVRMSPKEVIRSVKAARLRGRGGAGFPAGMKWEFARAASGDRKFILCNADEGEPGTFKDRVILTERPDRVFAGMTIAGYAVGASEGIMYLRGEYAYLRPFLRDVLQKRRDDGLLGENVGGREGFNFDIQIKMGAGAYVCGEETALISSCEGFRGDPRNRPPFPAQHGYLGCPSVVNNVETLCCVAKILEEGPATFASHGTDKSLGTKLLSISGDCLQPGVYEVELGIPLREVLEMCGGEDALAVQVSGPGGQLVGPDDYDRHICFDDLSCGGSIMVFGPDHYILDVVHAFMEFFIEESCGYCTPCRVGNVLLKERLERIINGRGEPADLTVLEELSETVKKTSRCGLGQSSPNPIVTSLRNFREVYESKVQEDPDGFQRSFDLKAAVAEAEAITGRASVHVETE